MTFHFRKAELADLDSLCEIEKQCFLVDRLPRHRLKHYISAPQAELFVACNGTEITAQVKGYGLLLCRRGTQLTRLYSLAVLEETRGQGVAAGLINQLAEQALGRGKRFMRLEVSSENHQAIRLYEKLGFQQFGVYPSYYEDDTDALRMQKRLTGRSTPAGLAQYPWYQQTTEFTCGPASLMMAMAATSRCYAMSQQEELAIWRRATTIFMTSGHGGCHPIGLALAAKDRGFQVSVLVNKPLPLFEDGVRNDSKKAIVREVENEFLDESLELDMPVEFIDWQVEHVQSAINAGQAVICLISTYGLDRKKAPHWVVITGMDKHCLYIHDPDFTQADFINGTELTQSVEGQHIPIGIDSFLKMTRYGKRKIRAAIIIGE